MPNQDGNRYKVKITCEGCGEITRFHPLRICGECRKVFQRERRQKERNIENQRAQAVELLRITLKKPALDE